MLAEKKFELERELALLEAQLKAHEHQQTMQMKMVDHEGKREEREAKAKEAAKPKASIEVKHGADELTGPIAEALSKFGEQMSKSQESQAQALMSVLAKASAPKRVVRDPKTNRVVGVETVQ